MSSSSCLAGVLNQALAKVGAVGGELPLIDQQRALADCDGSVGIGENHTALAGSVEAQHGMCVGLGRGCLPQLRGPMMRIAGTPS